MAITISKKAVFALVFIVFLVSLVGYINYTDKERPLVEEYIMNNKEILALVGEVESLKLIRIRKVGLNSKDFKYKKNFYRVYGKTKSEIITIRLDIESDEPREYSFIYLPDKIN